MASHADVQKYEELIKALGDFHTEILTARENMGKCVKVCQDIMGNDSISTNAGANIQTACKQYLAVCTEAQDLRKKLVQEKENLKKLIEEANKMGE